LNKKIQDYKNIKNKYLERWNIMQSIVASLEKDRTGEYIKCQNLKNTIMECKAHFAKKLKKIELEIQEPNHKAAYYIKKRKTISYC